MAAQGKGRIFSIFLVFLTLNIFCAKIKSQCTDGCDSLASYYVWSGSNLTFISKVFSTTVNAVVAQNPQITNQDLIQFGSRVKIPFSCGCVNNQFMGRRFDYQVKPGNVYKTIAELYYSNLTTVDLLTRFNTYRPENVPVGSILNVIVNCSCGNRRVSDDYGLFLTYPLRIGESLSSIGNEFGLSESYAGFNPGVDFSGGSGLVFVPVRGKSL
ncbi:PREDICTED: chitin elicitor receptor kinase 1-like [Erythranthe guttata]|uniref:chitin elicitor receptor kinase 1-like n=1 Tax=Erythranthe guttata TaxID=4155 RepID=UPI00064DC346|nr:PREDICTED: chitin elicitor receptor kinase 1-like [Erythranthe guttata]|eukprot:XP_012841974.1 PREDICTED: chitin elicitor receptor kinase 1-like [Erythranthe guttata]